MKRIFLAAVVAAPLIGFSGVVASSFVRPVPMYTSASCIEMPIGLYKGRVHTYSETSNGQFHIESGPFGGPVQYLLFVAGVF